jgi:hypothetical protein
MKAHGPRARAFQTLTMLALLAMIVLPIAVALADDQPGAFLELPDGDAPGLALEGAQDLESLLGELERLEEPEPAHEELDGQLVGKRM